MVARRWWKGDDGKEMGKGDEWHEYSDREKGERCIE